MTSAAVKKINGKDKFFLYFANGGGGIGVLTADSPTYMDRSDRKSAGNAKYARNVRCCMAFDPAVFVDDDGTGYLYAGGGVPGGSNPTQGQW